MIFSETTLIKVVIMVDTLPPHTPYPRWEVTGTATEGYITINVMQSGNIDVKQGEQNQYTDKNPNTGWQNTRQLFYEVQCCKLVIMNDILL